MLPDPWIIRAADKKILICLILFYLLAMFLLDAMLIWQLLYIMQC